MCASDSGETSTVSNIEENPGDTRHQTLKLGRHLSDHPELPRLDPRPERVEHRHRALNGAPGARHVPDVRPVDHDVLDLGALRDGVELRLPFADVPRARENLGGRELAQSAATPIPKGARNSVNDRRLADTARADHEDGALAVEELERLRDLIFSELDRQELAALASGYQVAPLIEGFGVKLVQGRRRIPPRLTAPPRWGERSQPLA